MRGKTSLVFALAAVALYFALQFTFTFYHEQGHAQIAANHGCLRSEIKYGWGVMTGSHVCLEYADWSSGLREQERLAQSEHESRGYTALPLFYVLTLILLLLVFRMIDKPRKREVKKWE